MPRYSQYIHLLNIANIADVLIVAVLMYVLIILFKQTRSSLILGGIGVLVAVYAVARLFMLSLTLTVLNIFFGMFFVILIIIFQEELRRFFVFLALMSTRRKKHDQSFSKESALVEEIVRTVANLAHKKIGALIVFPGHEHVHGYIEGGKTLDGIPSEELIESIFDPTSPGHDGAMLIQNGRVRMFGAHLPLSSNFREIGKHSTRHSAALGLAERSDAFIIVVSQEKGTISIARNEKLKELKNGEDLEHDLRAFLKEKFPEGEGALLDQLLRRNSLEKIVALAGAIIFKLLLTR